MTVRVLLADDQPLLRAAYKGVIDSAPDLEVAAEAATGQEAVELARQTAPTSCSWTPACRDMDGMTATRLITVDEELAGARVLVITTFEVDEYVFQALRAGGQRLPRQRCRAWRADRGHPHRGPR